MKPDNRLWVVAAGCVALLLLVLGAAARPLLIPDVPVHEPMLSAVEIAFVQDMTAHHQQALSLTQRLADDADPAVRTLARQIADSQRTEIGMLLGWLLLAEVTVTNPEPMAWMSAPSHDHGAAAGASSAMPGATTMPGAITQEDLDRLAAARGRAADVLFLRLMHGHHQGAVIMAQAADRLLNSGPVERAARDMITSQSREAGVMGMMLDRIAS